MRGAINLSRCTLNRLQRLSSSKPRVSKPRPSARLAALLPSIEQFLATTHDPQRVIGYVHRKLNEIIPTTPSPHTIYERVIKFLVRKRCPLEATAVYKRLHDENFVSSNSVDAHLLAVALSFPRDDPQDMVDRLLEIVRRPGFKEQHLFSLVQTMSSYDTDKLLVSAVVKTFCAARGPEYNPLPEVLGPLIASSVRLGYLEDAFGLLERTTRKPRSRAARHFLYAAYVSFLSTLKETRSWDDASINRVIGLMNDRGLPLQITVFNILLSREIRRGKPQNALAMYSTFKGMDFMLPDAQTFGSLFALYRRIRPRVMRKLILTPESTHLISLRQLYAEFVDAAQRVNHPMVMTTSVLNTAVRAFLRQRDYAGLVVVLNSFDVHRIPLDHHTYYSIMKHLIGRIWIEVTSKRLISRLEVKWCDRFLGVHFNEIKLSEDLVQHILFLVSRTQFFLEGPLHPLEEPSKYDDKGRYKMPTMEMMQSVDTPDPQDFKYEVVPLKRLVRRAIFADLPDNSTKASKRVVDTAVSNAKWDMIPTYQAWKNSIF